MNVDCHYYSVYPHVCTGTHYHGLPFLPVEKATSQMQFIPLKRKCLKLVPPRVRSSDMDVKAAEVLKVRKMAPAFTSQKRHIFLALCSANFHLLT